MIKKYILRVIEAVISLYWHAKHRKAHIKKNDRKCLFIPLFGMIGDGVLFLDALSGYLDYFHNKKGYDIVIGCRCQMGDLIKAVYPEGAYEVVEMDRNKMQKSLKEFLACLDRLSIYMFDLIINVRERQSDENILIYALQADKKVTFRNNDAEPTNLISRYFFRNTYDEVIYADSDSDQYRRYGKFLRALGYTGYVSHISRIPVLSKGNKQYAKPYLIISPGASDRKKCWPTDRFIALCDKITEKYNIDIYISGSKADVECAGIIEYGVKNKERVFDYCGNTSLYEWIELIRGAKLVISNDSASVHVAAAVQTPSVCITPQHDGYRFLPYQPDEILPDDILPTPVRCDKVSCFDCRLNNRRKEIYGDAECRESIKRAGVFKCIAEITVEAVYVEVAQWMNDVAENTNEHTNTR